MSRLLSPATLLAALVLIAVPALAQAATTTTAAGPGLAKPPPGVPPYADIPQFFPSRTVVHVGDAVRWKFYGFHSIYFPKRGGKNVSLVTVDPSRRYAELDPAGADFWFNGMNHFVADPAAVFPAGGKTENGTRVNASGLPRSEKFTYKLSFRKAGTYTYYCTIHEAMKGTVQVLPRGKRVRSAAQEKRVVKAQLASAVAEIKRHDRARGRTRERRGGRPRHPQDLAAHVLPGAEDRAGRHDRGLPDAGQDERDPHGHASGAPRCSPRAATPRSWPRSCSRRCPGPGQDGPPVLGLPGSVFFPTDPGPLSFDGTQHGGFLSTGLLGGRPLPRSRKVTFTKAGPSVHLPRCTRS